MCVRVSVCPVYKRWPGDYDKTCSRSFFTLCVSVCLCVHFKRDGQEIMMKMCVSVCLCVQSKRDSQEIMIRPVLDLSSLYVCPCVCVSTLKEMVKKL